MEATRLDVKLFTEGEKPEVELSLLIPVFHGWIQRNVIEDELLIDVADYSHVVDGPGVVLIGHQGQYAFERVEGRTGLLYSQRRAPVNDFQQALRYGLRHALRAGSLLQKDDKLGGRLRFSGQQFVVRINDRLRAPNTPQTWTAVEPKAREVFAKLFGGDPSLEPEKPNGQLFTINVRGNQPADVDTLLSRLT